MLHSIGLYVVAFRSHFSALSGVTNSYISLDIEWCYKFLYIFRTILATIFIFTPIKTLLIFYQMMCTKMFFMEAYYIILHSKIEENAIFNGRIRSGRRHDNSDHYIVIIICCL